MWFQSLFGHRTAGSKLVRAARNRRPARQRRPATALSVERLEDRALLSAGGLDRSFGDGGKVITAIGSGDESISAIAVQGDGKIVVAGRASNGLDNDFALVRYNADGSLDSSFGGDGKVTTAFFSGDDGAADVAIQADGKIIAAGTAFNGLNGAFALARYNGDGSLDPSFGTGGTVVSDLSERNDWGAALALQADGKIVVAGSAWNGTTSVFAVVRYNADGTLDASFGANGSVTTAIAISSVTVVSQQASDVAIQADGKIVAAGNVVYDWSERKSSGTISGRSTAFALARYNPDGSLDTTFSGDGTLSTNLVRHGDDAAYGVAVQADEKIVAAGRSSNGSNYDFALVRFNAEGLRDISFGSEGQVTTAFGSGHDEAKDVVIQKDGKIIAAGYGYTKSTTDFALARYNSDGSLDPSFDRYGRVTTAFGSGAEAAASLAIQVDGKIVAAGATWNGSNNDFALARYLGDKTGSGPTPLQEQLADSQALIVAGDPNGKPPDSPDHRVDANTATSPFAGVGSLLIRSHAGTFLSTGTPISPRHILTAAHSLDLNGNGVIDPRDPFEVTFNLNLDTDSPVDEPDVRIAAAKWHLHPDWSTPRDVVLNDDLAVIELSAPLPEGVPIYQLYAGSLAGQTLDLVGYGRSGSGLDDTWTVRGSFTVKRSGQNVIDAFIGQDDQQRPEADEVWLADFDHPTDPAFNVFGGPSLGNDREANAGPGDSGGPGFVRVGADAGQASSYQLAGIITYAATGLTAPPRFGSLLLGTSMPAYAGWVQSIVVGTLSSFSAATSTGKFDAGHVAANRLITSAANSREDAEGPPHFSARALPVVSGSTSISSGTATIWLDENAANWSWFVNPTPWDDSQFTTPGNQGEQNRMDLLTVLMHEIGHVLGQEHDEGGVMVETLPTGTRLTPLDAIDWLAAMDVAFSKKSSGQWRWW